MVSCTSTFPLAVHASSDIQLGGVLEGVIAIENNCLIVTNTKRFMPIWPKGSRVANDRLGITTETGVFIPFGSQIQLVGGFSPQLNGAMVQRAAACRADGFTVTGYQSQ
jgi:hypothetical protein